MRPEADRVARERDTAAVRVANRIVFDAGEGVEAEPRPSPAQKGVSIKPTDSRTPEPPLTLLVLPSVNVAVAKSVPPRNAPRSNVSPFPG